ncbi:MAG: helix-turn-helix domain-containing protein [Candidatus Aenigmatarchaeota archaeon]
MEKEEIIWTLQKFGMTEYESRAYFTLVLLGPAKALEVSKQASIPQSKIYSALESLMKKQLVEMFDGRPKLFKAIEPKLAIRDLLKAKEQEFSSLKQKALSISKLLKPIHIDEDEVEGIWVQRGEKYMEMIDKTAEMVKNAKKYVYGISKDFSFSSKFRKAVLQSRKKGVDVYIMATRLDSQRMTSAKWYLEHGIKIGIFEVETHPNVIVIDGREASLRLESKDNGFHSIWSKDTCFVKMIDMYLKSLWEKSRKINLFDFGS